MMNQMERGEHLRDDQIDAIVEVERKHGSFTSALEFPELLVHALECDACGIRLAERREQSLPRKEERIPRPVYAATTSEMGRIVSETIVDEAEDTGRARTPIVIVSDGPAEGRRAALDATGRALAEAGLNGRRVLRVEGPGLDAAALRAELVLLEEMPLAPHWGELVRVASGRFVTTAAADDWEALAPRRDDAAGLVSRVLYLDVDASGDDERDDKRIDRLVALVNDLRTTAPTLLRPTVCLALLALLGVPLAPERLKRLSGAGDDLTPWFTVNGHAEPVVDVVERLEPRFVGQALEAMLFRAQAEDAGLMLMLLRKLSLRETLRQRVREALDKQERAIARLQGSGWLPRIAWAKLLADVGLTTKAIGVLDVADVAPESGRIEMLARHLRATLYARGGKYHQAIAGFEELRRDAPKSVYVLQALASAQRRAGLGAEARATLAEVEWLGKDNPFVLVEAALIRTMSGTELPSDDDYRAAELALSRALEYAPGSGVVLNAWAHLRRRRARFEDARGLLEVALAREPWNVYQRVELATLLNDAGMPTAAERVARDAEALAPENAHALITLADVLLNRARLLKRAAEDGGEPEEGQASGEAERAQAADLLREALELVERAEGRTGVTPVTLTTRGRIVAEQGDARGAEVHLSQARGMAGDDAQTALAHASAYLDRGDAHGANNILNILRQDLGVLDEEGRAVLATLRARIQAARGDVDGGIRELEQAIEEQPPFPALRTTLINLHLRPERGEAGREAARAVCAEALELFPENEHLHLACRRVDGSGE